MLLPYAGASDLEKRCLRRVYFGKVFSLDNLLVFYGVKYQYFVKENPLNSVLSIKSVF
jgi:hypothetical protein